MLPILTALALLPTVPAAADEYEFLPDTTFWVEVRRVDKDGISTSFGNLDAAGNFVPDKRYYDVRGYMLSGMPMANKLFAAALGGRACEYRSGVLFRVKYDNGKRSFIPEVGGTVIDFRDYLKDYREGVSLPVYNLPGIIHKKGTPLPLTLHQNVLKILREAALAAPPGVVVPMPQNPTVPPESLPSGARVPADGVVRWPAASPPPPPPRVEPDAYEFVPDAGRRVEVRRRDDAEEYWSIGTLDETGYFLHDREYINRTGPKPAGTPAAVLLNRADLGACYEYRSGTLVKGRIDERLNFVPEVGSTVIDFKAYKYGPETRRDRPPLPIWNLPGSFRKKDAGGK